MESRQIQCLNDFPQNEDQFISSKEGQSTEVEFNFDSMRTECERMRKVLIRRVPNLSHNQ